VLNGTQNQFAVGYDTVARSVSITTGNSYSPAGTELVVGEDKSHTAEVSSQSIVINGVPNSDISVYNIGGNNYFKLRDLGSIIGFFVDYDPETNTAIIKSTQKPTTTGEELNSEQVFAKCSPAIVYITVYDRNNRATASGSGFFVESSGVLITNYHVIDGCYYATIETSDTQKKYNVLGVYNYNEAQDWAVLKVDGSGFNTLEIGDTSTIIGGAKVFAIGSPLGLQNTISEGIISNPSRSLDNMNYIQTSAAISHGSSGGALINKNGKVIGITCGGFEDGQNLNLAIPISYVSYSTFGNYTSLGEIAELKRPRVEDPVATLKTYLVMYGKTQFITLNGEMSSVYTLDYTGNDGRTYTIGYADVTQYTYISEKYKTAVSDEVETLLYFDGAGTNEYAAKAIFNYFETTNPPKLSTGAAYVYREDILLGGDFSFYYWWSNGTALQYSCELQCYKSVLNILNVADGLFNYFDIPLTMADFGYIY